MQASASKDSTKKSYAMYGAAEKISEGMLTLMQSFGIQELTCRVARSADFERIVGDVQNFADTPQEIIDASIVVKDCLAAIIASAGVVKLTIDADQSEKEKLVESYRMLVKMASDEDLSGSSGSAEDGSSDSPEETDLDAAVNITFPGKESSHE